MGLREALIKLSWSKLSSMRAIQSEEEIIRQSRIGYIISGYSHQVEHEKNIFEFVTNIKSALDAIATFLNVYFDLNESGGNIDLKKIKFRTKLIDKDS
jgi:hypothetical protein